MNDQLLSLAADPRLIEIALCIGVIVQIVCMAGMGILVALRA